METMGVFIFRKASVNLGRLNLLKQGHMSYKTEAGSAKNRDDSGYLAILHKTRAFDLLYNSA